MRSLGRTTRTQVKRGEAEGVYAHALMFYLHFIF